jgi:LPS export ABC transporter protein LptC
VHLNLSNVLGLGVLAAGAIASWYWSREEVASSPTVGGGPSGPSGYYLRGASISIMDEEGHLLYEISADAIEEQPAENRTVLSRVEVRYSPRADVPWELSADNGEIPSDEQYIELSGDVEITSTAEPGGETTIIRAPRIRFAPDDFLASTDSAVSVLLGEQRLDAVGMSADLKGDYLQLESSVHGQFNP